MTKSFNDSSWAVCAWNKLRHAHNTQTPCDENLESLLYKQLCLLLNDAKLKHCYIGAERGVSQGQLFEGQGKSCWWGKGSVWEAPQRLFFLKVPPPVFCFVGCDFPHLVTGRGDGSGPFTKEQWYTYVFIWWHMNTAGHSNTFVILGVELAELQAWRGWESTGEKAVWFGGGVGTCCFHLPGIFF